MQFSPSKYSRLKNRLKLTYEKKFLILLKSFKRLPSSKMRDWLLANQSDLKQFSQTNWYFIQQLEMLHFFIKQPDVSTQPDAFTAAEDEVFERWNNSEFAEYFLKLLNRGKPIYKASKLTSEVMEQHLISLGNRHILKLNGSGKQYRLQPSLGDTLRNHRIAKLLGTTLHLNGKELNLMTSSLDEMKIFSQRIEIALKVIKKFSPSAWERFSAFTEVIIPIKDEEFVSYSHQELPGTSMINLYHRDFVDLMDDLLHENGHHHLNYYLNLGKLIEEPIDCIYYSPWRRTPRPLRAIFHAYFTFFWGFKFFSEMASSKELDSIWYIFSPSEKEKIYWRAVEEFWMLDYTFKDLQWAKKQGLINQTGWKLIKEQRSVLLKYRKKVLVWEKKLKGHRKELTHLKRTLKLAENKYVKN